MDGYLICVIWTSSCTFGFVGGDKKVLSLVRTIIKVQDDHNDFERGKEKLPTFLAIVTGFEVAVL